MKYGHIEENTGKLLGWYDSEIHAVIPTPNIELTDEKWQAAIDSSANHYNGSVFDTVDFRSPEELVEDVRLEKLKALRTELNNRVDSAVGTDDPRKKDKTLARSVGLLLRKVKGIATVNEEDELDAMDTLREFIDTLDNEYAAAESWIKDEIRSPEEIQGYDVAIAPGWSTPQ